MSLIVIEPKVQKILDMIQNAGGYSVFVGGCVRDAILGIKSKDLDIEVYQLAPNKICSILEQEFQVHVEGKSFGILKLKGLNIDISIPRREFKTGTSHRDFFIDSDPFMSLKEAAKRRDFTINSIAYDPLNKTWIDPYGGKKDLKKKILRHTSNQFSEDPLRVLRAMQFIARFDLDIAPETLQLCKNIKMESLSSERVFEEWKKLIVNGKKISKGLQFLKVSTWIQYFEGLSSLSQKSWEQVLHAMDQFTKERVQINWEDLVVGFAVLCSFFERKKIDFFLKALTNHKKLRKEISFLIMDSFYPPPLHSKNNKEQKKYILHLAKSVGRIDRFVRVMKCSLLQEKQTWNSKIEHWILQQAKNNQVLNSPPKPLITGKDLLKIGIPAGSDMGKLLYSCMEEQIEGNITNFAEGIEFVKTQVKKGDN